MSEPADPHSQPNVVVLVVLGSRAFEAACADVTRSLGPHRAVTVRHAVRAVLEWRPRVCFAPEELAGRDGGPLRAAAASVRAAFVACANDDDAAAVRRRLAAAGVSLPASAPAGGSSAGPASAPA